MSDSYLLCAYCFYVTHYKQAMVKHHQSMRHKDNAVKHKHVYPNLTVEQQNKIYEGYLLKKENQKFSCFRDRDHVITKNRFCVTHLKKG